MAKRIARKAMKKAKKKAKKKRRIDSRIELAQYMTKASISLGAALYHARKLNEHDMAEEILKMAIASERLEGNILGKKIDRIQEMP